MSDADNQRRAIEAQVRKAKKHVEIDEALARLESNRDFKKIITEGYFRDEAVRLVHLKAAPDMQTPHAQAAIVRSIDAIGELSDFFRTLRHNADNARKEIETAGVALEEISEEEAAS